MIKIFKSILKSMGVLWLLWVSGGSMALHAADSPAAIPPTEIPLEIFGKHDYISSPALSPDGKNIAALIAVDGVYQIAVADFEKRRLEIIFKVGRNDRTTFNWINWANNSRLVASYSWLRGTTVVRTTTGLDLEYTRLIALDKDGKNLKYLEHDSSQTLRGSRVGRLQRYTKSVYQDHVISYLPNDAEHILIQLDGGVYLNEQHVYKLNVYTGQYTEVKKNFQNIYNWYADRSGELRLGEAADENKNYLREYHYRKPGSEKWTKILEYEDFKEAYWDFLGFDATGEKLYFAAAKGSDTDSLYVYDANTDTMSEALYRNALYDVRGIFYDETQQRVTGVEFTGDYPQIDYFKAADAALQKMIDQALPGLHSRIVNQSSDGARKIIASVSDRQPLKYFLYDQSKNAMRPWYDSHPDIKAEQMAERRSIRFKARDGMELYGYLTLPKSAGDRLPAVIVYPHGGPWARDTAAFEPFAQALASRGYAVLQVNFRGSTGYGGGYKVAGFREWGKKMQNDIADGLLWARQEKLVAENRACIMGMSYGGYAALMGLIRDPDLYQCAISFAAVTDLVERSFQRGGRGSYFGPMVGDAGAKDIRNNSPMHLVEHIKAPVLLMHGERDVTLDSADTVRLAEKMQKLKKKYKLVLFENGDHHFSIQDDRIRFLKEVDSFLQEHLPAN